MNAMIALAGNPNCGKTCLFNALTGARQHVGNYPGVTVEKKQGIYRYNGHKLTIVDLPGTYSLTAYSLEEVVARDFLVNAKPHLVINIVDASNLERNLYLTVQFMEMGIPVCVALNMIDVASHRGIEIDSEKLSALLNTPVVATVARNGKGKNDLMHSVATMLSGMPKTKALEISYGKDIDETISAMMRVVEKNRFLVDRYRSRWTALKFIENDEQVILLSRRTDPMVAAELEKMAGRVASHIQETLHTDPEGIIADHRYGYIRSILEQGVVSYSGDRNRLFISDKIDKIAVNRFAGPFIMVAVLFAIYQFTFVYSKAPEAWLANLFAWLGDLANAHMAPGLLKSLVISGMINGVGGVMGFVPIIMFMFLGISVLEDSGYLARVAFMLDRLFRIFGLHGSSIMPFIVSGGIAGGCAVPGAMATRTLKSPRERLATLLTIPFMNCGAKLPVFALLVAAFFVRDEAVIMLSLTLVSWLGALVIAKLLRTVIIRGDASPFVMELPPYRIPTLKTMAIHTWERTWQYVKKAGTVILGVSIILWALMTFPTLPNSRVQAFEHQRQALRATAQLDDNAHASLSKGATLLHQELSMVDNRQAQAALKYSIAGRVGSALEILSQWAGFDWRTDIALIGGFAAKEVIVSTLGTAYSLGQVDSEHSQSLAHILAKSSRWSPLAALSLMIFVMFYSPCFVATICITREAGSFRWGAFVMVFNTALAFLLAVSVFQIGRILGF